MAIQFQEEGAAPREVSGDEFREAIERHELWLNSDHVEGEPAKLQNIISKELGYVRGNLRGANLAGSQLNLVTERRMDGIWFDSTDLDGADLHGAQLYGAYIRETNLRGADLRNAQLSGTTFIGCDLTEAKLGEAGLSGVQFMDCDLRHADLAEADLNSASLIQCKLQGANLTGARVYGVSAWDLETDGLVQRDLVITRTKEESSVTVDNLEVAQFVYLMLNNPKIRGIIDTIGNKGVLILGRFYKERKAILDAIRERLRDFDLVPMVFDWEKPTNRDLTETVLLLASMSKFVVADVTDAKSIPQELSHIVPQLPSVPIRPIILKGEREYAMFEHWTRYPTMLDIYEYRDKDHLVDNIHDALLKPVEAWQAGQDLTKSLEAESRAKDAELAAKEAEIAELRARLDAQK